MRKLLAWENVLAGLFLTSLVYAIFFSIAPVGLSAVLTCAYSAFYAMTGNIEKENFGKAVYLCTYPAVIGFSVYFFWATTWFWLIKLAVGILVGFFANLFLVHFVAFNIPVLKNKM